MRFFCVQSIDSTNSALKRALALPIKSHSQLEEAFQTGTVQEKHLGGADDMLALMAFEQTGGYGRRGNRWKSPVGGCYLSLALPLIKTAVPDPRISLGCAVALHRLLSDEFNTAGSMSIKWPNDLFVHDSKLAGISLEVVSGHLLLGIGLNVFNDKACIDIPEVEYQISYLEDFLSDDNCCTSNTAQQEFLLNLGSRLALCFEDLLSQWVESLWQESLSYLNKHLAFKDRHVVLEDREGRLLARGRIAGVDISGALCLQEELGTLSLWSSGEIHMRLIVP